MRILMMPSGIGHSHLTRLLQIGYALQEKGATVAFVYHDPQHPLLLASSFLVFPTVDITVYDFTTNIYEAYTPTLIHQCIKTEYKAIVQFQPDVVVGDLRLTAVLSARLAKLPFVSVVNGVLTRYFDPITALTTEKKSMSRIIARAAANSIQTWQKKSLVDSFHAVAKQLKMPQFISLSDFLEGDLTLVPDIAEFCPLEKKPDTVQFIGAMIWEGVREETAVLPSINPQKTVIYITAGNTGQQQLLEQTILTFGQQKERQLIVTTGPFIPPQALPTAPNCTIHTFLSGSQILAHADLAIHCGGSGSTYQAIGQGVPTLVVPFNNEQKIYGRLVQKNGLGKLFAPQKLTDTKALQTAVNQLLTNSNYRKNLEDWQPHFHAQGAETAAKKILTFISEQQK